MSSLLNFIFGTFFTHLIILLKIDYVEYNLAQFNLS